MTRARPRGYEPTELVPPGETLTEWLDREGMSQVEFAKRARLTPKHITQVVKGKVGISPEVALAFERVTAIPARYWTQLDANYQTSKHRQREGSVLRSRLDLVDMFPTKELERRGYLQRTTSQLEKLRALLQFFGVAGPEALEEVWLRPAMYRKSPAFQGDAAALASWLRIAELEAARVQTADYDAEAAKRSLSAIRALSRLPGVDWVEPLTELCASVGIALVIVKELPKCRVNGATRWPSPERAMIALSLRYRRNDIFWFTLFHEMCHLLRHSKKETFIDGTGTIDAELEAEADAFASRVLVPPKAVGRMRELKTAKEVEAFAEEIGVAPGIIVGRMQHEKLIPPNRWTSLLERYRFSDD